ncbi:hypothetical protein ACRALDRAFT_2019289 [Sodiomyces alcalophilus JCM 7366]|uniref:uncharacterized protein n=1 Tax=Sodiomyces alcalophilus JCM 7366 TaxID=591952 RepID=UPI0039B4E9D3
MEVFPAVPNSLVGWSFKDANRMHGEHSDATTGMELDTYKIRCRTNERVLRLFYCLPGKLGSTSCMAGLRDSDTSRSDYGCSSDSPILSRFWTSISDQNTTSRGLGLKYAAAVREHGGELHILPCDITKDDSMRRAVSYCSTLPPVKGVSDPVLSVTQPRQDWTFSQMTMEEWKLPLQPKVFGTIKLDNPTFWERGQTAATLSHDEGSGPWVPLVEGDDMVSYETLRATFQAILDLRLEEKNWAGMLTTDNRDTWASVIFARAREWPELFSDPVWKRGYPRLIMQTMIETKLAEDPGYTMEDPESVWMSYTVNDDSRILIYAEMVAIVAQPTMMVAGVSFGEDDINTIHQLDASIWFNRAHFHLLRSLKRSVFDKAWWASGSLCISSRLGFPRSAHHAIQGALAMILYRRRSRAFAACRPGRLVIIYGRNLERRAGDLQVKCAITARRDNQLHHREVVGGSLQIRIDIPEAETPLLNIGLARCTPHPRFSAAPQVPQYLVEGHRICCPFVCPFVPAARRIVNKKTAITQPNRPFDASHIDRLLRLPSLTQPILIQPVARQGTDAWRPPVAISGCARQIILLVITSGCNCALSPEAPGYDIYSSSQSLSRFPGLTPYLRCLSFTLYWNGQKGWLVEPVSTGKASPSLRNLLAPDLHYEVHGIDLNGTRIFTRNTQTRSCTNNRVESRCYTVVPPILYGRTTYCQVQRTTYQEAAPMAAAHAVRPERLHLNLPLSPIFLFSLLPFCLTSAVSEASFGSKRERNTTQFLPSKGKESILPMIPSGVVDPCGLGASQSGDTCIIRDIVDTSPDCSSLFRPTLGPLRPSSPPTPPRPATTIRT